MLKKIFTTSKKPEQKPQEVIKEEEKKEEKKEEEKKEYKLNDFELLETLGTGTFGKVKLCKLNKSKEFFAMKIMLKEKVIKLNQVEHLKNERNILYTMKECPFITKIFTTFQDEDYVYIVMEYIQGGELFSWCKYFKGMKESVSFFKNLISKYVKVIVAELVVAFEYLHNKNIIYRDLKPENVLIDKTGHIKITDFGFAKQIKTGTRTYTTCGTPECLAPEVILGLGQDKAVDYWALGILTYELLHGFTPFHSESTKEVYQNIIRSNVQFPIKLSSSVKDFIILLLEKDPKARLGCSEKGIEDIKNHIWFKGINWSQVYKRTIKTPFIIELSDEGDTKYFSEYEEIKEDPKKLTKEQQELFKDF